MRKILLCCTALAGAIAFAPAVAQNGSDPFMQSLQAGGMSAVEAAA